MVQDRRVGAKATPSYYPLPTTYYLLPTTHCLLLPSSSALGGTEFQLAVKRAVPHGCTFKGFPQHFTHQHAPSMLSSLMQSTTGLAIVQCKGEQARLAPLPALQPTCNQPATSLATSLQQTWSNLATRL